jgi:hypothetical protein
MQITTLVAGSKNLKLNVPEYQHGSVKWRLLQKISDLNADQEENSTMQ